MAVDRRKTWAAIAPGKPQPKSKRCIVQPKQSILGLEAIALNIADVNRDGKQLTLPWLEGNHYHNPRHNCSQQL